MPEKAQNGNPRSEKLTQRFGQRPNIYLVKKFKISNFFQNLKNMGRFIGPCPNLAQATTKKANLQPFKVAKICPENCPLLGHTF